MTSQLVIYSAHVILLTLVWLLAATNVVPVVSYLPDCAHTLVYHAPIYGILILGAYAAFSVIYGVATFNDCSEAKEELLREIKEAREELKKRKVIE